AIAVEEWTRLLISEEVQRTGAGNGLRPAFDAELAKDMIDVFLDSGNADHEPCGDFLIGMTVGDQAQHVQFALAEGFKQGSVGKLSGSRLSVVLSRLPMFHQYLGNRVEFKGLAAFPGSLERRFAELGFQLPLRFVQQIPLFHPTVDL